MESQVTAHQAFQRWALWTLQPDPTAYSGSTSILQRIEEGKGVIMPGAPRKSGRKRMWSDGVAVKVETFMGTLAKEEKQLLRVYYLSRYNVHDKARQLGLPTRTMYYRLGVIQKKFDIWRTTCS